jgi:hypothetical protein
MDNLICGLLCLCWVAMVAVCWRAVPLPQPPIADYRRSWALLGVPWRSRVAFGIRIQFFILSR